MAEDAEPSLSEILAPTGEKTAPPAAKEPNRDESGKFAATEKAAEPAKAVEPAKVDPEPAKAADAPKAVEKPPAGTVAALIDERRKRQEAEARLRELESKAPAKAPSVFEDEDKAITHRVGAETRPLREALFNQSVKIARLTYKEGFESAQEAFAQAAEKDERLITALRNSEDPGEFIYTTGLQLRELGEVGGDFVKYREKLTGDLKTQLSERDARIKALETELAAAKEAQLSAVPKSLNTRSSSPKSGEIEDDEPIEAIARFNNRKSG